MTQPRTHSEDWALHAYADGEIAGQECRALDARLASDPDARAQVEAWRRQKAQLRQAYAAVLDEPVPGAIMAALRRRPRNWAAPLPLAAALLLAVLSGLGGWFLAQQTINLRTRSFADLAIEAHEVYTRENRHAVEVAASESEHLTSWLSRRVGHNLVIPDLSARGYTLLGGRLLAAADRPAAQLMYENPAKRRITVFLAANATGKETAFLIEEKQGVTACYWLDGPLRFVITGEGGREEILALARAVYDSFDRGASGG